ncbi:MAG: F0F1 ATP synthase subunit B [Bacteroides sp.]|jgi:ATP synthase, F0 subunit b
MSLITPDFGLFFWMLIAFGLVVFVLGKFAWKPILNGLKGREDSIADALNRAKQAQEEVVQLQAKQEEMAAAAQADRDRMVDEARKTREAILAEAKEQAQKQAEAFIAQARQRMEHEEEEMRAKMREDVAKIAVMVAERILREHLADDQRQGRYMDRLLDEVMAK